MPRVTNRVRSLSSGYSPNWVKLLTTAMQERLREHFNEVIAAKEFQAADVAAGRLYVKSYVEFIHFVERVYEASATATHGHFDETNAAARHR